MHINHSVAMKPLCVIEFLRNKKKKKQNNSSCNVAFFKFLTIAQFFVVFLSQFTFTYAGIGAHFNLTNFKQHRAKRALIFEGGGTIKLVIGPTLPLNLGDPITWRSVVISINLHGGHYTIPTEPLYPWDKWEDIYARQMRKMRNRFDHYGEWQEDGSRLFLYTAVEDYMNRNDGNGRECLLRSICENAQVQQHVGIFAELLDIVLTPGKEKIDAVYEDALKAGKAGADCLSLYRQCPKGTNIFDYFVNEF